MSLCRGLMRQINKGALPRAISRKYASEAASTGDQMSFTFASPAKLFYNKSHVKQVDVPSFSGSFGVLPKHVPTVAVLKPGVVKVYEDDSSTKEFFVSSGSITIDDNSSVQLLAEEAVELADLDPTACRNSLSKAQSDLASAGNEKSQAEAKIAVEVAEALVKAVE